MTIIISAIDQSSAIELEAFSIVRMRACGGRRVVIAAYLYNKEPNKSLKLYQTSCINDIEICPTIIVIILTINFW